MARAAGIVFSAVIVFIISVVAMLAGALVLSVGILSYPRWTGPASGVFGYCVMAVSIFLIGLGGWGIAAGVGILNTRRWARTSMLVFGVILLAVAIPAALEVVVDPLVGIVSPYPPENMRTVNLRAATMAVNGVFAVLGGFWLYFFNKKSVKEQFSSLD